MTDQQSQDNIQNNLEKIRQQVAEHIAQRNSQADDDLGKNATASNISSPTASPIISPLGILAVSKTHSPDKVETAYQAGQMDFGENYMQEAVAKVAALKHLPLCWHFIGHLQSNKARLAAENFDWVQSVDSLKLARKLSTYRGDFKDADSEHGKQLKLLNITMQINISREDGKHGIAPELAESFCQEILSLPNIKLRGLMAIPEATDDPDKQQGYFNAMRKLFQDLKKSLNPPDWDTLSMGMSGDMTAALAGGSNMLRIGTAIFGTRP